MSRLFFLLLMTMVTLAYSSSAKDITIRQSSYTLTVKSWDDIRISDPQGTLVMTFTGLQLNGTPKAKTSAGRVREIMTEEDLRSIEIDYDMLPAEASSSLPPITVTGFFTAWPDRLDISYTVSGPLDGANLYPGMIGCKLAAGAQELDPKLMTLWQRHEYGGVPVEYPDVKLVPVRIDDELVFFAYPPEYKVNFKWKDGHSRHLPFIEVNEKEGGQTYEARMSVLLAPQDSSDDIIAARLGGRPLSLSISTDQLYNWWTSIPGAPAWEQPLLTLNVEVGNATGTTRQCRLNYWVRDYAGRIVSGQERMITLEAGEELFDTIDFQPSPESDDPSRDLFFAEVSVTDLETGEEIFARTNLALLPPHEFVDTSEDSLFGIAAYWPIPDEQSAQRVMDRMGVRWLREGDNKNYQNITAIHHNQIPKEPYKGTPEDDAWIHAQLEQCVEHGNPYWEFGNEINYGALSIGVGDMVKDQERHKRIARYMSWLKAIRRIQEEMGPPASKIKILSLGLAGMDVKFVDELNEAGGWDLLDGMALHPGRGNFVADYPVNEPWTTWVVGAYGSYWNYFGAVSTAVEKLNEIGGDKELWLTEVYSPGFPNSFWEDSLRNGAENTLLSLALAESKGVKAVLWYQLFDTVWYDRMGVNPHDREYFFGLIQRDLSFKPSLLAYCTAAEEFDQADFERWLTFEDNKTSRGLLFDSPRGPLSVLWDRSDGYVLTERKEHFASPEPWLDRWETRTEVTLPVAPGHDSVTVINEIGQRHNVSSANGRVTLPLSGAPVIVYGLDTDRL
jgi:hypothetical protein